MLSAVDTGPMVIFLKFYFWTACACSGSSSGILLPTKVTPRPFPRRGDFCASHSRRVIAASFPLWNPGETTNRESQGVRRWQMRAMVRRGGAEGVGSQMTRVVLIRCPGGVGVRGERSMSHQVATPTDAQRLLLSLPQPH